MSIFNKQISLTMKIIMIFPIFIYIHPPYFPIRPYNRIKLIPVNFNIFTNDIITTIYSFRDKKITS